MVEIDPEQRIAIAEPGDRIERVLPGLRQKHGLVFGPDPASAERATLGGSMGQ